MINQKTIDHKIQVEALRAELILSYNDRRYVPQLKFIESISLYPNKQQLEYLKTMSVPEK